MITLNLPKKQVNAILVALDTEIDYTFDTHGRPDWETFPEFAAMLMAYYTTRSKFEDAKYAEDAFETEVEDF
jgi:hypothetical protein